MAEVKLVDIKKSYGATAVIHDVNLAIADGEFVVFVGPSGCGKSTLLRIIAGLESVSGGEILIDGHSVTNVPASDRGLAMVFQSYALYPHMSVYKNMAFALENMGLGKGEIDQRVRRAAQMLRLTEYLDRKPKALSGGQRQRVAIGRAIVRDPKIFLFDEPLSNLDAELRVATRKELAALHAELGGTMIYVTHDQVEAMTLADRIVVLRAGRIEQIGTPLDLYNNPANLFVAGFIGSPRMNLFPGRVSAPGQIAVGAEARTILVPSAGAAPFAAASTSSLPIRPAGPLPRTSERSMPWAAATRLATGVIREPSGTSTGATAAGRGALAGSGAGASTRGAPAPAAMRPITWPTVTVSPGWARISVTVPVAGAGTSASTLSVEISTIVSSASIASPTCLAHSSTTPSLTDSPIAGMTMSTTSSAAAGGASGCAAAGGASGCAAAGPLPLVGAISASTAPTWMVSPSAAWTFTTVPSTGAGTSASTLSVDISTSVSSAETESPSALCHSSTVPSLTESPIAGMTTSTVVVLIAIGTESDLIASPACDDAVPRR